MKEFIDKLIERLEEVHEMNDKSKNSAYEEEDWEKFDLLSGRNQGINIAISIVNELAEEYKADKVYQLAMMYAKNIYVYGVDVTKAWESAVQNHMALEQAYMRGRQDEIDRFTEEYKGDWK